jgi:AraC-like DNA-binding protein
MSLGDMKSLDCDICERTGSVAISSRFGEMPSPALVSDNSLRIERTIRYMQDHLDQSLQASDLAAVANLSLSHYFALFKRVMGCAPIDYFIRLRMKRACRFLETTALNVKEIAGALGYDDPFYFSRLFKSVNGMAPSDYRRACQNGIELDRAHQSREELSGANWGALRDDRIVHGKQSIFHSVPGAF